MADREFIVMFEGDQPRVSLATETKLKGNFTVTPPGQPPRYHVLAPDSRRAELIARAMRKK